MVLPDGLEELKVIHISNLSTVIDVNQVARFRCVLNVSVSSVILELTSKSLFDAYPAQSMRPPSVAGLRYLVSRGFPG